MKFLKNLILTCLTITLIAGAIGYYYGIRPDNYKEYLEKASNYFTDNQSDKTDDSTAVVVTTETIKDEKVAPKVKTVEFQPLPANPFAQIDKSARNCPRAAQKDIPSLAAHLTLNAKTDLEKARAIYVWLTDNINYDDKAYNSEIYGDYSAESVLKNKLAVCEGFSNLFLQLGLEMGLDIKKVVGYSKGYGYKPGQKLSNTDHAWNIIKIDGNWRVFDATWGQGYGVNKGGKLESTSEFNDYWFNVDPYEAIFTHMPELENFTKVTPNISLQEFEKFPKLGKEYFTLGFNGQSTFLNLKNNSRIKFPNCFPVETHIEKVQAHPFSLLKSSVGYVFEFYVPRGIEMAIINSKNKWTYFEKEKGLFKITYFPNEEGNLKICVKHEDSGSSYQTVLEYEVKNTQ
jgi:hypothetical protein